MHRKMTRPFLPLFLSFKLILAFPLPYFSPKTHETGPKVLVLAQAMPRAKKAKLNHMLPVGGQILVTRVQNKSDFICSIIEWFLKFHDRNSRKFVYKLKFSCYWTCTVYEISLKEILENLSTNWSFVFICVASCDLL